MYLKSVANQGVRGQNSQISLFSPTDEAALYHAARSGFFTLNTRADRQRMQQTAYRLDVMPQVLDLLDPNVDSWLSQGEFLKPNRRVVNLARIGLLFVDLDYYRVPEYDKINPETMCSMLVHWMRDEGLPQPSVIISSGQGLQLKWLFDKPIPRQALPRWNACQRRLVEALRSFGADPAAKDASRILRVVRTVNSKSGDMVRVIHAPKFRYGFDELAEMLLPVDRFELEQKRQNDRKKQLSLVEGGKRIGLRGFSSRQLAWHRLEDLRTLAKLRGGVQEGERMQYLFWQLNFLLLSGATNSTLMWHEAAAIARELDPNWGYRSPELTTLFNKAREAEAGQKVEFGGRQWTPLYTPKNATLIDLFEITSDEERLLRTVVSKGEAARRNTERLTKRRRAAGAVSRIEYAQNAADKAAHARELRTQGMSVRAIAKSLGISKSAVDRYIKS